MSKKLEFWSFVWLLLVGIALSRAEEVSLTLANQFEGLLIFLRLHLEPKVMGVFAGMFAVAALTRLESGLASDDLQGEGHDQLFGCENDDTKIMWIEAYTSDWKQVA